jgi:hypothetical protein
LLNQTFTITNIARAGQDLSTMVANVPIIDAAPYSPFAPYAFITQEGGINDLNLTGATAATVVSLRVEWAQGVQQIGYKALWLTMVSSLGDDSVIEDINAALRTSAAGLGVTVVDVAEDPCLGTTGVYANTGECSDFQADGLHMSQAGADAVRNYTANIVNYLTGATAVSPTAVTAASYAMLPADGFIAVTPAAGSSALTLPSCVGFGATTPFTVYNRSATATVTVAAPAGQLLNGAGNAVSVAAMGQTTFVASPLAPAVGGCTWSSQ